MVTFLELNGRALNATEDEEFQLMLDIAAGMGFDETDRWLRDHLAS